MSGRIDPRVAAMRPVLAHLAQHGERMCKTGGVVFNPPECEACGAPVGSSCRLRLAKSETPSDA